MGAAELEVVVIISVNNSNIGGPVRRCLGGVIKVGDPVVALEEVNRGGAVERRRRMAREVGGGAITVVVLAGLSVLLRLMMPVLQRRRHVFVENSCLHARPHLHTEDEKL